MCAIEIDHTYNVVTDFARNAEISVTAKRLLDTCVLRHPKRQYLRPIGGVVSDVGQYTSLVTGLTGKDTLRPSLPSHKIVRVDYQLTLIP